MGERLLQIVIVCLLLRSVILSDFARAEDLLISHPEAIRSLEAHGLNFGSRIGQGKDGGREKSLAALSQHPGYAALVGEIDHHLATEKEALQGMRSTYDGLVRFFGERWLRSPDARFRLTAVVGRPDRIIQSPESCGEVRLLYRLAYRTTVKSRNWSYRLPMTLSLVYRLPQGQGIVDCASRWRGVSWGHTDAKQLLRGHRFVRGIVDGSLPLVRVEANLQLSRWAYTNKSKFSDQVHYLLLSFAVEKQTWRLQELENTPDVTRLEGDAALRQQLKSWLTDPSHRAGIETGRLQIPSQFLAKSALSISPYHLARKANRPFTALFGGSKVDGSSGRGSLEQDLLARLDGMTCQGCHQSHGTAGFHFLGEHHEKSSSNIFLMSGRSLHFEGALSWRQRVLTSGNWYGEVHVPRAERLGVESGALGDFCEPPARACHGDLVCQSQFPASELVYGICMPGGTRDGNACDDGVLASTSNPLFDRWTSQKTGTCPVGSFCAESDHGFPQGLCSRRCELNKEQDPATICVPVPQLGPYETCLNSGRHFTDCAGEFSIPSIMARCAGQRDCRPDYGCFGTKKRSGIMSASAGKGMPGFCAPIYVDPELTVEHHPPLR